MHLDENILHTYMNSIYIPHKWIHIYMFLYICSYIYVYMFYIHIYLYIYIYIHIHIHTYIHIHGLSISFISELLTNLHHNSILNLIIDKAVISKFFHFIFKINFLLYSWIFLSRVFIFTFSFYWYQFITILFRIILHPHESVLQFWGSIWTLIKYIYMSYIYIYIHIYI
jgi:hypothetical protein